MFENESCSCCGKSNPFSVVLKLGKEHIVVCEDCLRDMLEVTITNRRNLEREIEDRGESLSSMLKESGIDITEDELSELFGFSLKLRTIKSQKIAPIPTIPINTIIPSNTSGKTLRYFIIFSLLIIAFSI